MSPWILKIWLNFLSQGLIPPGSMKFKLGKIDERVHSEHVWTAESEDFAFVSANCDKINFVTTFKSIYFMLPHLMSFLARECLLLLSNSALFFVTNRFFNCQVFLGASFHVWILVFGHEPKFARMEVLSLSAKFFSHEDLFAARITCRAWNNILYELTCGQSPKLEVRLQLAEKRACSLLLSRACGSTISSAIVGVNTQFCRNLRDHALLCLVNFPNLTDLNLNGCHELTDNALVNVFRQCPKISRLSLYWNPRLTDKGLSGIALAPCRQTLCHLNLSGVKHLTDSAIQLLASSCPNLSRLDLTRLGKLTDLSLVALASLDQLTYLNLYACTMFTDAGLDALAKGCPRLAFLDLCGCHTITDASVYSLSTYCPLLASLNLTWCGRITDEGCFCSPPASKFPCILVYLFQIIQTRAFLFKHYTSNNSYFFQRIRYISSRTRAVFAESVYAPPARQYQNNRRKSAPIASLPEAQVTSLQYWFTRQVWLIAKIKSCLCVWQSYWYQRM